MYCQGPWSMVLARQQYIVKVLDQCCGVGSNVLSKFVNNGAR